MKKIILFALVFAVSTVAFGQDEIFFRHIDSFIRDFPQSDQEAWDRLASWGYIKSGLPVANITNYFTEDDAYTLLVFPRIDNDEGISFSFIFHSAETTAVSQTYRRAVNYFIERYSDFSRVMVTEDDDQGFYFYKGNRGFSIAYSYTYGLNKYALTISITDKNKL